MKSFFSMFKRSINELQDLRTLTTTGMFIALAIVLRVLSIQITPDIRVTFSFLAIAIIAMLYGPVVSGMACISVDFIGFLLDNKSARGYYPPLAVVTLIAGIIYGIFLYRKEVNLILVAVSRIVVVVICNICLNSYFIYTGFVNKDFSIFSNQNFSEFRIWIIPRLANHSVLLPIEIIMLCIILPIGFEIYKKINKGVLVKS